MTKDHRIITDEILLLFDEATAAMKDTEAASIFLGIIEAMVKMDEARARLETRVELLEHARYRMR